MAQGVRQLASESENRIARAVPDHVSNSWLGHSGKVAEDHYLQVTEEHWQRASVETALNQIDGNAGGNLRANPPASDGVLTREIVEKIPKDGLEFVGILMGVPPKGLELY